MWAVLTRPEEWSEDEFFSTGEDEIAGVMRYAEALGLPRRRQKALDFGCGLGRLTRALAGRFDEVVGVDVSESMVEGAGRLNQAVPGCAFRHNPVPDLAAFGSGTFDLVYSNITLQHMSPALAKGYIREFIRVVSADGLVLFQLPTGLAQQAGIPTSTRHFPRVRRLKNVPAAAIRLARQVVKGRPMEMNCIPEPEVLEVLRSAGARLLDLRVNESAGPAFESRTFAAARVAPDHGRGTESLGARTSRG
jgi:SAM-dependent methyltransferase